VILVKAELMKLVFMVWFLLGYLLLLLVVCFLAGLRLVGEHGGDVRGRFSFVLIDYLDREVTGRAGRLGPRVSQANHFTSSISPGRHVLLNRVERAVKA
jgi:hypothetical protein